jgi:hypothetical protein
MAVERQARCLMGGISNGGYLTRCALEHRPDLYDGGVDGEGVLRRPEGPNLFTFLPAALKHFPRYRLLGDPLAYEAMIAAGFARGSEFIWEHHYAVYWDLTQRTYREEIDPPTTVRSRLESRSVRAGHPRAMPITTTPRDRRRSRTRSRRSR